MSETESSSEDRSERVVGRGHHKLAAALEAFGVIPAGWVCADLGCNVGGFVGCLLARGAERVYAVDTGYGALDYQLRRDPRVVAMERTNAMHVRLPEAVNLVTIDVGWTRQKHILPAARAMTRPDGQIISLIKPHYEAEPSLLRDGVLPAEHVDGVVESVASTLGDLGLVELGRTLSPLPGHGGNQEVFLLLAPKPG